MDESYLGFHVGDRVQKVGGRSENDPIAAHEKGFVCQVDSFNGAAVYWDRRLERSIVDTLDIKRVEPESELKIFHNVPCLQISDSQDAWDNHCSEVAKMISALEGYAEKKGCLWVVKQSFLDEANRAKPIRFTLLDNLSLNEIIDSCDTKNGIDVAYTAKRIPGARSLAVLAHGQNYTTKNGAGSVTEMIECRLVASGASEHYREKIDQGAIIGNTRAARIFFSSHQHEPLDRCIHDCRVIANGKDRNPDIGR